MCWDRVIDSEQTATREQIAKSAAPVPPKPRDEELAKLLEPIEADLPPAH